MNTILLMKKTKISKWSFFLSCFVRRLLSVRWFNIILPGLLIFASCKKTDSLPDFVNCTNLVKDNKNVVLLPDNVMDTIKHLFYKNNINYDSLQFCNYSEESLSGEKYVRAYNYVNNLRVFTDNIVFEFNKNDSLLRILGKRTRSINVYNVPKMTESDLRSLFFRQFENDFLYINMFGRDSIENSCIDMEYGYYNKNSFLNDSINNFVCAWLVHPHKIEYPLAYVDDSNGKTIYYFNGILFNKK